MSLQNLTFKAVLAVVAFIALVGAKAGVNTYVRGDCGVRISHVAADGQPTLSPQDWNIVDSSGKLFADGTNHTATVYIPAGTYRFNSGNTHLTGHIGVAKCEGKVLHTFKVSVEE